MKLIDTMIKNIDWLITVDSDRRIITDAAIAISEGKIVAVGKTRELESELQPSHSISGKGKVAAPGLIDSHIHADFQLSRGLADEVASSRFLFERMYPYESLLTERESYWSGLLCSAELIRHGVTTFIDPGNYHPYTTAQVIGEVGNRGIVAKSAFDIAKSTFGTLPASFNETTQESVARSREVVADLNGSFGGRVRSWLSFRGVNNCTDQLIVQLKDIADENRVGIQAHACFAKETLEASLSKHGIPEIERLHRLGVLDQNLLLIHMGWVMPHELVWVKEYNVKVVCAPSSSLHNGYGNIVQGKLPEMLEMGVAVGLGSDHASSGIVDIVLEMFLASTVYKEVRMNAAVMPPERAVEMATINGARCALWEDEIGSIEVGKQADITMFNTNSPEWQPLYNPVSNLVYSANGSSVDTVMVGGKLLLQNGEHLTIDMERLYREIKRLNPVILKKTNLQETIKSKWTII
jgi:5-methylthioadenosine/S-adenosylhomocysteine deaminase